MTPRAVLFDLDDTLFDHRSASQAGLEHWMREHPELAGAGFDGVEATYSEILEAIHLQLMAGELPLHEARVVRTRSFFERYGCRVDDAEAWRRYVGYRSAYDAAQAHVPGAIELLDALKSRGLTLGVVTNNMVEEQVRKLDELGLAPYFDAVVISEEVGVSKPDPRIYEIALERVGHAAGDTVMVGDSLTSDILGAEQFGMRAVWLERYGLAELPDGPDERFVLRSLLPHEIALRAILYGARAIFRD